RLHQLLVAVDDKVGLLEGVDAVAGAHDPLQVEADAVGRGAFQAVDGLALGADDAAAVDAQAASLANQAELHRVPVQPGQVDQRLRADAVRLDAAAAVGGHVVGEDRVHQQRDVAEQVVEQVRFAQVVQLFGFADPPGDREAAVGQVLEEGQFRQQALDADQLPAGGLAQHRVELVELRDAPGAHAHGPLLAQELLAGPTRQHLLLAREQRRPDLVVGAAVAAPGLLDHGGGVDRHVALVGELVFDAARFVHGGYSGRSYGLQSSPGAAQSACKVARIA